MDDYLGNYGWNKNWQIVWDESVSHTDYVPARIIADFGKRFSVACDNGLLIADASGALMHKSSAETFPKIGDWVALQTLGESSIVKQVLPRRSELIRGSAGSIYSKQVFASNVDVACVVQSADNDFNINRLRRYMFQLNKANIRAILVLNKIDTDNSWQKKTEYLQSEFPQQKIIAVQGTNKNSVQKLQDALSPATTAVIVGSSGVGKSTIINSLLGFAKQATQAVRADDLKGKHTTTHREMFLLQNGALLIDTPGVRELQLWGDAEDVEFIDEHITKLQRMCKFTTCSHTVEPGCAVVQAIKDGVLSQQSLVHYNKLKEELETLDAKNIDVNKQKNKQKHIRSQSRNVNRFNYDQSD